MPEANGQQVDVPLSNIYINVLLEGALSPTGSFMLTNLRDKGYLPGMRPKAFLAHPTPFYDPYQIPLKNNKNVHFGLKEINQYPLGVVDIIVVELLNQSTGKVISLSSLLLRDGNVDFSMTCTDNILLDAAASYTISIDHRNHHRIVSALPISIKDRILEWDATQSSSLYSVLIPNIGWVMKAGKLNKAVDGISDGDLNIWQSQRGENSSYLLADINLDGDVNMKDQELLLNSLRRDSFIE